MEDIKPTRPKPTMVGRVMHRSSSSRQQQPRTASTVNKPLTYRAVRGLGSAAHVSYKRAINLDILPFAELRMAWTRYRPAARRYPVVARIGWGFMAVLIFGTVLIDIFNIKQTSVNYNISDKTNQLIGVPRPELAQYLKLNQNQSSYEYNQGYQPGNNKAGLSGGPKFTASLSRDPEKGVTVTDPTSNVGVTFKPDFALETPRPDSNRLVYPLRGKDAAKIYTLRAASIKEDIVLNKFQGRELSFGYTLQLANGTEARIMGDGSLGIYGVNSPLLGNVTTSTESDAKLLEKALKNGKKDKLLFVFPAPFISEINKRKATKAKAWFTLQDNRLTVHAADLDKASYPLSIDPTIYIETAAKLMQGNNETNLDFDIENELFQKGKTTGARFDTWESAIDLPAATWNQATAVAGGYMYTVGGELGQVKVAYSTAGATTFLVPNGVTSITVKMWGGGGGGGGGVSGESTGRGGHGGGAGYVRADLSVTGGETLDLYVGGGGNGAVANAGGNTYGDGGSGGGYSSVYRTGTALLIAGGGGGGGGGRIDTALLGDNSETGGGGGAGGGASGTVGGASTSNSNGGGFGTAAAGGAGGTGSSNSGTAGAALTGGAGADGRGAQGIDGSGVTGGVATGGAGGNSISDNSAGGGGGGSGRFGGGGGGNGAGGGGGGGGSSLTSGTNVTNTAGSTTTPGNSGDTDRSNAGNGGTGTATNGTAGTAGRIVITYTLSSEVTKTLSWAKIDSTNYNLVAPNPGSGACSTWCSNSAYDLPNARKGFSLVAYNGFLYAIGGDDNSGTPVPQSTVYIAKLGANGEPQKWHPTDTTKSNWVYWHAASLGTSPTGPGPRSYAGAVAYNNRLYVMGGKTASTPTYTNTTYVADILPTGALGTWSTTGMVNLSANRYGFGVQAYNDRLYVIGGNSTLTGAPLTTVQYIRLNSDGTMAGSSWITNANSFSGGRQTWGGNFTTAWGAYIYVSGGCSAVNATTGYCTTMASDTQVASINADGSLDTWNTVANVANQRMGHSLLAWRSVIYRIGGCTVQNATTGLCDSISSTIDYGVINPAGELSTVSSSVGSGTSPCSGVTPYNCHLPTAGDSAGQGGHLLTMSAILNGYLYVIGGCTNTACSGMSGNVSYSAINSSGQLVPPPSCGGTSYGSWCVDATNRVNTTTGLVAGGITTFNNRIYIIGGNTPSGVSPNIYYNSVNASTGALSGAWSSIDMTDAGIAVDVAYTYVYSRANPASAGTYPGNLYVFGGCTNGSGAGCTGVEADFRTEVYKCNIMTSGALETLDANDCDTAGQLQIDSDPVTGGNQGLGIHSGTVYANYVYMIGGYTPADPDKDDVILAKIDNNNNVVAVSGGIWQDSPNNLSYGRRRGWSFGYNGHIYSVGGYDSNGGNELPFVEWAKVDVSDGSNEPFETSSITIAQRWGLSMVVSNSYAYVLGGCSDGPSPTCNTLDNTVQVFQLYNNNSGTADVYNTGNNLGVDRIGGSATIYNGYIYYAGGCTDIGCTTMTNTTYYAPIDSYGVVGTWSAGGNLPASLAWGKLVATGGSLYYVGGQTGSATTTAVGTVHYTSGISSGNPTWATATRGIGDPGTGTTVPRTQFGAAVWNNRIYITGGYSSGGTVQQTVYTSPVLSSGGNITANWPAATTTFNVSRAGHSTVAYANNLYVIGGFDGTNYLSDVQYTQINSDANGTVDSWLYSTSLPRGVRDAEAFAANGYVYLVGGRTAATTCLPSTLLAPISANTVITSDGLGNNPTGVGDWYETNAKYAGNRYGAAVAYGDGKVYVIGGGCSAFVTTGPPNQRMYYSAIKSQPQVAKYSRMIDADTDVFPNGWLMNGIDNSIGARWQMRYRSMTDIDTAVNPAEDCGVTQTSAAMSTWGQDTNFGDVTMGKVNSYTPKDGSGGNTNCARYFYFFATVDASQSFGYPDDVTRGPTISDLSLFFTADPSKRMLHGKTFTGGLQQPLDTPCRQSNSDPGGAGLYANCPLP